MMNIYSIPGLNNQTILRQVNKLSLSESIISAVCDVYHCKIDDLRCKCHKRDFVEPRQIIMALSHIVCGWSLYKSGAYFLKNHATVVYSIKAVKNLYQTDHDYRMRILAILKSARLDIRLFEKSDC
jgi:chromosomal replication initiation ATPase DnaA